MRDRLEVPHDEHPLPRMRRERGRQRGVRRSRGDLPGLRNDLADTDFRTRRIRSLPLISPCTFFRCGDGRRGGKSGNLRSCLR